MKKIFLTSFIIASFIILPLGAHAEISGLTAQLERIEREPSGFSDTDSISFFVKITNTTSQDIRNFVVTGRMKSSKEYIGGYYGATGVELLPAGQSTTVVVGGSYLISSSKELKNTIKFYFSDGFDSAMQSSNFDKNTKYKSKINSKPLSLSVNENRGKLDIKIVSKDTSKKYKTGAKGVKLISTSFKSNKEVNLLNPAFIYHSNEADLIENEITNLSLWSGKVQLCGPLNLVPIEGSYQKFQHSISFQNCEISILKNKKRIVTLKGDISQTAPQEVTRNFLFSGYSLSESEGFGVDYKKPYSSQYFNFK